MKKLHKIILILIILFGSFLRIWELSNIPPGVIPDEADTGYSAYSILHTGLSQYGTFNPLAIEEASGGSHPPLYTYSLIPLVKFFGLNIFIERLPSVIFGILTIPIFFLVTQKLFKNINISLLSTFLLSVNPWAIAISRQGLLEAIAVFFVTLGILLFLHADKGKKYYILSAIVLGLSLFSYDAPKVFLPLFLIPLTIYKAKTIKLSKKNISIFLVIFGLFYMLIIKGLIFDGNTKDLELVARSESSISMTVDSERYYTNGPRVLSEIFHNKLSVYLDNFLTSYFSIFSINQFFLNGTGNFIHSVGPHGLFHTFELPFFFIGIYLVLMKKPKEAFFLLLWLLLGSVPGGITEVNNPFRSTLLLPVPIIFSSFAIVWFFTYLNRLRPLVRRLTKSTLIIIASIFISSYLYTYFYDFPVYASKWWRHEENEALRFAYQNKDKYDHVFVTNRIENTYAFLFLTDPERFQDAHNKNEKYRDVNVIKIDNIYFGSFTGDRDKIASLSSYFPDNSLIIANEEITLDSKPLKEFKKLKEIEVIYRAFEVK
jgi:4-amino-4-deoxy-L-arabinose transferase-like glycosyltransferase